MDWIKHYGKASMDSRMEQVIDSMGCFGVGLYWRLCERIECWGNGSYPRKQLIREMKSRRLNSRCIHAILDQYELFITDENGQVSLAPIRPGQTKKNNKPNTDASSLKTLPKNNEPTSRGTLVAKGTNSLQPLVEHERTPHGTSVHAPQRAHVRKRDKEKKEYNNNITLSDSTCT